MVKKGLVIAAAVAASLALAGCASQGSACGTTATPVAAPAPMNACKNMSSCKHKHHMKKHHVMKKASTTTTTETTTK